MAEIPLIKNRYYVEEFKEVLSADQKFCSHLAIKIGSKIIEMYGSSTTPAMGITLASTTWRCIKPLQKKQRQVDSSGEIKNDGSDFETSTVRASSS